MRCTALTAVFFALFALFSSAFRSRLHVDDVLTLFAALAYAAPIPQGAMLEGRQCSMSDCRNASPVSWCQYTRVIA